MFVKRLSLRAFWIGLLVVSGLWSGLVFVPVGYSLVSPTSEFQELLRALEMRGPVPAALAEALPPFMAKAGTLRRALQISYYTKATAILHLGDSHTERTTQEMYLSWFDKVPRSQILLIQIAYRDGAPQNYSIQLQNKSDVLPSLMRAFIPPLLLLAFSIYVVFRKKPSRLLDDPETPEKAIAETA